MAQLVQAQLTLEVRWSGHPGQSGTPFGQEDRPDLAVAGQGAATIALSRPHLGLRNCAGVRRIHAMGVHSGGRVATLSGVPGVASANWGGAVVSEVDLIAGQVVPVIGAAVSAYGAGVLTRVQDAAAEATVGLGQRLLAWLLRHAPQRASLEAAVTDLATDGNDPDAIAALRLQIRKILNQDPDLAAELAGMLPPSPQVTAMNTGSVTQTETSGPTVAVTGVTGDVRLNSGYR